MEGGEMGKWEGPEPCCPHQHTPFFVPHTGQRKALSRRPNSKMRKRTHGEVKSFPEGHRGRNGIRIQVPWGLNHELSKPLPNLLKGHKAQEKGKRAEPLRGSALTEEPAMVGVGKGAYESGVLLPAGGRVTVTES
jgi:hypothetical protein